ncbi:hypothetical protein GOODEAATRI_013953 [Goodea atripinnis]|uniref:Uncharacterized protein n=1 Tax=Goodea atripinnis TaxID=208336 RepID=A0ABV0PDY1_9TELE
MAPKHQSLSLTSSFHKGGPMNHTYYHISHHHQQSLISMVSVSADVVGSSTSQSVIFYTASSIVGRGEAGAYLQQSTGGRQGSPWTGHQSIAGQHTNNQAHTHSYT